MRFCAVAGRKISPGRRGGQPRGSLPDRPARAGQTVTGPFRRYLGDDVVAHADLAPPFALRFRRPFIGRVEPDLAAKSGLLRGEIEIVDRRVLDDSDIARPVRSGPDRPHYVLPC